jgi:hypothetical protein
VANPLDRRDMSEESSQQANAAARQRNEQQVPPHVGSYNF